MMKIFRGIGKAVVTIIGIFVVILVLAVACSGGGSSTKDDVSGKITSDKKYEFVEEPIMTNEGYGSYYVKGIIKNNTNIDKDYVQISFTLYDADGNNVGTAYDNINNLKAGGTWKFKAMGFVTEGEVVRFELDSVDGF